MPSIYQIIGRVNPKLYAKNGKALLKKYGSPDKIPADEVDPCAIRFFTEKDGRFKMDSGGGEAKYTLVYDSSSETLEPLYFFILDLMNDFHLAPEKLIDNFTSSPGSGHFGDLGMRMTALQQQATRTLADINTVIRSILNLVYDLKDFQIRLHTYNDMNSSDKATREAALLALKQIWMDKVDINKGNSSIKAMAFSGGGQIGMQTLVDAFLFVKDESLKGPDGKEVDLNERVKRVVKQRIQEFNLWLKESEKELRKRYEMERKYLKSQVNSVKLYSRWAKPYLKTIQQLEMKDNSKNPNMIKTFNSILLELTLLGKSSVDIPASVLDEKLPKEFKKMKLKRNYYSCVIVDFNFRGIPQKVSAYQQHYAFGGRAEVTFSAYALNDEELKVIREELEKADVGDALKLIEGATSGSLEEMQDEIESFLKEEDASEKTQEKKMEKDSSNPFLALLGFYNEKSGSSSSGSKGAGPNAGKENPFPKSDDYLEKTYLRPLVSADAKETTFTLFDVYKKAHGMPSYT